MGICKVLAALRPWQNAYAERCIGSLLGSAWNYIIIFNESSLRRILKAYFEYYEHSRTLTFYVESRILSRWYAIGDGSYARVS